MMKANKSGLFVDGIRRLACIQDLSNNLTDSMFNWIRDAFIVTLIRMSGTNSKHLSSWVFMK